MRRLAGMVSGAAVALLLALLAIGAFDVWRDAPSDAASVAIVEPEAEDRRLDDTPAAPASTEAITERAASSDTSTEGDQETVADEEPSEAPVVASADTPSQPAQPALPVVPEPPGFDVVRIDDAGKAIVAGRAVPDQAVTLRLDGEQIASARADAQGNFVSFFDIPQTDAPQVLSLESVDPDGAVQKAEGSVIVAPAAATAQTETASVSPEPAAVETPLTEYPTPETATEEPEVSPETPVETQPEETTVASAPRLFQTGPEGLRVLSDGGSAPDVRTDLGIDAITYNAQGDVQLAGRAGEGAELRIYLDNRPIRDVQVDGQGAWASQLPDVPPGVYTLRVDAIRPDGGVERRIETPFERTDPELAAAQADVAQAVTVQPGFTLWAISEGHFGDGVQYVQIFEANRDIIRDPDLIYPGQIFTLPDPG